MTLVHGTVAAYAHGGCRCAECREAQRIYQVAWKAKRRAHPGSCQMVIPQTGASCGRATWAGRWCGGHIAQVKADKPITAIAETYSERGHKRMEQNPYLRTARRGPGSARWAGIDIGYSARHMRLGPPRNQDCALRFRKCKVIAESWALDWHNVRLENLRSDSRDGYQRVWSIGPNLDYLPACWSCHNRFDRVRRTT